MMEQRSQMLKQMQLSRTEREREVQSRSRVCMFRLDSVIIFNSVLVFMTHVQCSKCHENKT